MESELVISSKTVSVQNQESDVSSKGYLLEVRVDERGREMVVGSEEEETYRETRRDK